MSYGGYSNDSSKKKKKFIIMGVSSMLLVAMVVGVAVTVTKATTGSKGGDANTNTKITATSKAVEAVCQPTDYKEICVSSLNDAKPNNSNPTELIKIAFDITIKSINEAIDNASKTLKDKVDDTLTKHAIDSCKEQLEDAIDDLKRSLNKLDYFSIEKMDDYIADLGTWLSAAVTYQETCIDGFENTTSDAGEKMKSFLKKSKQLTSNGLAMVTDLTSILKSLTGVGGGSSNSRRLLSEDGFPSWVDGNRRRLLESDMKPNVVVAKDGSGKYKKVTDALKDIPQMNTVPFVIYVKEGVYNEQVTLAKKMKHVVFIGDGPTKTKITGRLNFAFDNIDTFRTATVAINSGYFTAKNIGFENSAGPEGHQAVAVRVTGDNAIFFNCQIDGYQDTLYAHAYRQFYRDCTITGTIDFIFGDASAVFQNCKIKVRKPMENQACIVTAQGRSIQRQRTGIVLHNCVISGEPDYLPVKAKNKAYLGRPWKKFSRTIIMNTHLDDIIDPAGWMPWNTTNFGLDTCYYSEHNNKGPGAVATQRVNWKGIQKITPDQANLYTPKNFIDGDSWIPTTGVPYISGMN